MAYATFTLTGSYPKFNGVPSSGVVEIIPSETQVLDAAGKKILSGRVKVTLEEDGTFDVLLPDPNDATLNPTGFGYTVVAKLHHTHLPAVSFGPEQVAGGVVDMATITPVDPSTFDPVATYATASEVDALGTRVTTLETTPSGVTSYLELTDKPTIPATAADVGALPDTTTAADLGALPVAEADTQVSTLVNDDTSATSAALSATIATEVEPKADKAKVHPHGGQYLAPVRVPALSVVESWPNAVAPFYRLMWTENAGATLYGYGRDRSIWKSTDSGVTWARTGQSKVGVTSVQFGSVFWKTTAGSLLAFRYDYDQLYRSTDDGATWTSVHTLPFKQLLGAQSICQDRVTGHVYYAEYPTLTGKTSTTAKVWRSTDDGATWAEFYAFSTSGADGIDHIHSIQWDHVAQRVVISAGDSNPAAGMYRINAAGTGVEPMVLNRDLPAEDLGIPRTIGIIPQTDYLVWAADTGNVPWVCRMHRSQIGQPNPVVEKVYRLNSSAWWTCKASDDGSRWVLCASGENPTYRIDTVSHLYAVEDQGATVYEIGTIRARKEDTVTLAPVGAPENHGDVFFMQTHTDAEPGSWKFALGLGSGVAIPWPQRIQVPASKTLNYGPVSIAAGAEVSFWSEYVPFRATTLHLIDIGATAGVRCVLRINGVDVINTGQRSERANLAAEWSASILTLAAAGGQSVEVILKNQGGATVTDARAFITYGWGGGAGLI